VTGGGALTVVGSLAPARVDDWRAGRRIRVPALLRRPSRYLDPGVPDNERALARRGTTLVGTVKSGALVEVLARGRWWSEAVGDVRAFSRRAIAAAVAPWSGQSAAIVSAIVIGDRAGLDEAVQRRLQEAGTYHVIAISGGNIAILASLMLGAFRVAGWLGRTAMLASIVVLVVYAVLVGGGASVDRATLMAVVYFGGRALDHRSSAVNTLFVVAALLVAVAPLSAADPAFVLTFGATVAILVVIPAVSVYIRPDRVEERGQRSWFDRLTTSGKHAGQALIAMFAASVAVEILLFPVGALFFSRITLAGLALNLVAIPLMAVAQVAGMLVVPIAAFARPAAWMVGWVAHVGAAGLVRSADLVHFAPLLTWRLAPPSWAAVAVYYCAVGGWWTVRRLRIEEWGSAESPVAKRLRVAAAVVAIGSALWILVDPRTFVAARGDGRLHATFIDVGQGDSIFIVFPHGSTMLVDAGGLSMSSTFDIGDRVVAPVIRDAGFRRIDYLALTHGDPDHIGGAASISAEFRPREVWEGVPVPRLEALTTLRRQIEGTRGRWINVLTGDRRTIEDVDIVVHHPPPADWERQKVRNDDSIVLELRWRDVSILLTGDIGRVPERAIASSIAPAKIRVVKIPHHGSLTSSTTEFVHALHPTIAIVSAGRSNHFGHPVPEVLDRYRAEGAEIYRTDRDGAVVLETDGTSIAISAFAGRTLSTPEMQPRRHENTKKTYVENTIHAAGRN